MGSILDLSSRDPTYLESILSRMWCHPHVSDHYSILNQVLLQLGFRALEKEGKLSLLSRAIPVVRFLVSSQKSLHTASLFSLLCTLCLSSFSLAFCAKNVVGEGGTAQEMPLLFSNDISSCIWMGEFEEGESIKSVESCSAAKSNWYILALETVEPFLLNFGPFLKFRFWKSRGKRS